MTPSKIIGVALMFIGVMMGLSLASYTHADWPQISSATSVQNWCGRFGALISFYAVFFFGWSAALWPLAAIAGGISMLRMTDPAMWRPKRMILSFVLILCFACGVLYMIQSKQGGPGGTFGWWLNDRLGYVFGGGGTALIFLFAGVMGVWGFMSPAAVHSVTQRIRAFPGKIKETVAAMIAGRRKAFEDRRHPIPVRPSAGEAPRAEASRVDTRDVRVAADSSSARPPSASKAIPFPSSARPISMTGASSSTPESAPASKPRRVSDAIAESNETSEEKEFRLALQKYRLPPLEILKWPPEQADTVDQGRLQQTGQIMENTLKNFGIEAQVMQIIPGPTVTLYEVLPAPGVQVSKIAAREAELKMALAAVSLRILAPIPGKSVVGIEVPNPNPQVVKIRELLAFDKFTPGACALPFALGKDILGKPVIVDLQRMPHGLIAGATGSGKSVCIASLLITLLCRLTPAQLRLILIDPKRVELSLYSDIAHLLSPPITDSKEASAAFKWLMLEMESRYSTLQDAGQKNIEGYNVEQEKLGMLPMPYIVLVVDELADLILTERRTVEGAITRLAQMSRAVGIHLILATQRPSVDVITGLIKANMPARIAFQVISVVDSKTILDTKGADDLMGRGDMLYLAPGALKPIRLQGAFVDEEEIRRVVDFIRGQMRPIYVDFESVPDNLMAAVEAGMPHGGVDVAEDVDPKLYDEAKRFIIQIRKGSTAMLQKKFRVGFNKAQKIMDMLEKDGVVGPNKGPTPRDVLIKQFRDDGDEEAGRG